MAENGVAVAALFVASLGAAAEVLGLLRREQAQVMTVCPNCGQPFDKAKFPTVWGVKLSTCPRCGFTW